MLFGVGTGHGRFVGSRGSLRQCGWSCGLASLFPPRSLRTRGEVEQSLPRCWCCLLRMALMVPSAAELFSVHFSVFLVYPYSLRVFQLDVGLTIQMMQGPQGQNNWKANANNSGFQEGGTGTARERPGTARGAGQSSRSSRRKWRRRNTHEAQASYACKRKERPRQGSTIASKAGTPSHQSPAQAARLWAMQGIRRTTTERQPDRLRDRSARQIRHTDQTDRSDMRPLAVTRRPTPLAQSQSGRRPNHIR